MKRLLERIDREILAAGGKKSRSRAIVIEGFFRARDHVTIEELTRSVRESAPGIGAVTVYRTLKLLERIGYAKELDFGDGARRYESNLSPHHDHLVCLQCGRVEEFYDARIERRQIAVARERGFEISEHALYLYVECVKVRCPYRKGGGAA